MFIPCLIVGDFSILYVQVELVLQDDSRCLVLQRDGNKKGWIPSYLLEPLYDEVESLADKIE